MVEHNWRNTSQHLLPPIVTATDMGKYDVYPTFPAGDNKIQVGFSALAVLVAQYKTVIIDGYGGVFWEYFRTQLETELSKNDSSWTWLDVQSAMKSSQEIDAMLIPFLGGDDPLFGTRFTGDLRDFYDSEKLNILGQQVTENTIVYGSGSALVDVKNAFVVYVDVPKNEIQFRSRSGAVTNLGRSESANPKTMYKQFYFVDWVALNKHKCDLLDRIDCIVDEQRRDTLTIMSGDDFRATLKAMSQNFFRVRPWFEPGVWGGQWIKERIGQISPDVPNYAWSFELITPENGLLLESDGNLLEVSFDFLMYANHKAILGYADRFQYEFPIRFNFLDTFDGGNLSVQCHPSNEFVQAQFGETFTQDETYYILDCKSDSVVYIGFQEGVDPEKFHADLQRSYDENKALDIHEHVNHVSAHKHDLILIPNQTIHSSGKGVLVLEISATPYIFTFKLYDWVRPDLTGKPRPLNLERGMKNLDFDRQGQRVFDEHVSKPAVIQRGQDWQKVHLPTHELHFYDVFRYEFDSEIELDTGGDTMHVMSLVEGTAIQIETENGMSTRFNYVETFVVPAATGKYKLLNLGQERAKVVHVILKRL
jgi:mannose-6-phosphate isomerase class I